MKILNLKKKEKKQRDYIKISSIILSLFLVLFICLIPNVYADDKKDENAITKDDQKIYGDFLIDMAKSILTSGTKEIVDTVKGNSTAYSDIYSYMTGIDIYGHRHVHEVLPDYSNTFATNFKDFITFLKWIAAFWVIIIAAANLIKGLNDGREGQECVLKFFYEVCLTCLIIINLDEIVPLFCTVVHEIILKIDSIKISVSPRITAASIPSWKDFINQVCGAPDKFLGGYFIWRVGATMQLMLPWIMSKVVWIASLFVLLQTLLEIGIRRAFLAFAVADIYNEGLRSPGARYIKKFVGAMLKFGICVLASKLTDIFIVEGSGLNLAFNIIVINIVAVGVMFKAGEYTNDILGA